MPNQQCDTCNFWRPDVKECAIGHEKRCENCRKKSIHTHSQPTQQQQQQQQPKQLEFLSHRDTDTQRLNRRQRDAIITLHQNGDSINDVCMKVGCAKSKTEPDYARSLNNRKLQ
jgi:hypothetical protein